MIRLPMAYDGPHISPCPDQYSTISTSAINFVTWMELSMSTLRLFFQISVFLLALSGCGENTSDNDTGSSAVATENCETSIASDVPSFFQK